MKFNFKEYIENNTLRLDYSRRGGGIKIDVSEYLKLPGAKMIAYQNYLGGGMLGAVCSDRNFSITNNKSRELKAKRLAEELKKYFHNITNEEANGYDEYSSSDYESNQIRPESAY